MPVKANRLCFRVEESTKLLGRQARGPVWPRYLSGARRSRRGLYLLSPPKFPRALSAGESGSRARPEDTA